MELEISGHVADPEQLEAELTAALGIDITLILMGGRGDPQLQPPPGPVDVELAIETIETHQPRERQNIDQLVEKARAVWNGTDTFTAAQSQKILAGLVLLENRRR